MPICDLQTYRRITDDGDSYDGDVTLALADAQDFFEQRTSRLFESAARTEVMRLYKTGRVYPRAFPITSVTSGVIDGASVLLGFGYAFPAGLNPFTSGWGEDISNWVPQVSLTYTGGYVANNMPVEIVRAVAQLAYQALHTAVDALAGVPAGVTSVRLGDLAYAGAGLGPFTSVTPEICRTIDRYKRRQAVSFA